MEIKPPTTIEQPSKVRGELCPKCRQPQESDGWCTNCSRRRKVLTTLGLLVGMPTFGLGSCFLGLGIERMGGLIPIGLLMMVLGPILGIIYLFFVTVISRK